MNQQQTYPRKWNKTNVATIVIAIMVTAIVFGVAVEMGKARSSAIKSLEAANTKAARLEDEIRSLTAVQMNLTAALNKAEKAAERETSHAQASVLKIVPLPSSALEEPFDAQGDWVVQLHTLYNPYQFSIEKAETAAAFEKCSIETDYILEFCASEFKDQRDGNGYNTSFAALAKGRRGFTARQAVRIADCFNRNMKPAKDQPNAADAVKMRHFELVCMDDKPGIWNRPSVR